MKAIGIDVGGMSIKIGVIDEMGNIVAKERLVPNYQQDGVTTFHEMTNFLKPLMAKYPDIMGIGLGVPGFVNPSTKLIEECTNIKSWVNVPAAEIFKEDLGLPTYLGNDANLAMLGEACFGEAKKAKDAVLITLGTGVGSGFFLNGKLYTGGEGKGTEFGHTILVKDGRHCGCGRNGCVEAYCSASALIKQTREAMEKNPSSILWQLAEGDIANVGASLVFKAEALGDKASKKIVEEYVSYLGEATINLINLFRPEVIIYGGGVAHQRENLTSRVEAYLDKKGWGCSASCCKKARLCVSNLGNDAGMLGAAALVLFPDKQ